MVKPLSQRIAESRLMLGNPYAYLDDQGNFSGLLDTTAATAAPANDIVASRLKLKNQYAHLDENGGFSAASNIPSARAAAITTCLMGRYAPLRNRRKARRYRHEEIEAKATELQRLIWDHRNEIWPNEIPKSPIDMLDPGVGFQLIGFDFDVSDGLGQYFVGGQQVEVAGLIDDSALRARTSRRFSSEIQNFTAAHELGHAMLHDARGLHRDRPLDGGSLAADPVETEANRFASCFLMPAKLVKQYFEQLFGTACFVLNEDTRFALSRGGVDFSRCSTQRDLSRILARATNYNGVRFQSLATQFRVSEVAMAIRLEEIGLVPA